MRTLALALAFALALAAAGALAQPRPQSTAMTCRQAAALVSSRGAVVLGTGGHTYDRYVRDRGFCAITEATKPGFAPTLDDPQCFVGYRCFEPSGRLWDD
jgi:ABC-type sugar transport system substrate-binding protein